jgi:hypothetical protein
MCYPPNTPDFAEIAADPPPPHKEPHVLSLLAQQKCVVGAFHKTSHAVVVQKQQQKPSPFLFFRSSGGS